MTTISEILPLDQLRELLEVRKELAPYQGRHDEYQGILRECGGDRKLADMISELRDPDRPAVDYPSQRNSESLVGVRVLAQRARR